MPGQLEVKTEIEIDASPEKVYDVLVDFPKFPDWNPFIVEASGDTVVGGNLKILIQPPGGSKMGFNPKVLVAERGKEFRWIGKVGMQSIFAGEHYYLMEQLPGGKTKFTHGESFKGLLLRIPGFMNAENISNGFKAMNVALKKRVEESAYEDEQA